MDSKYHQLCALLTKIRKVAVAYSGGVDSTLLLKAAVDSTGSDNVIAIFARSVLQKSETVEDALSRVQDFGCIVKIVDISPLSWKNFTANSQKRCYFCKKEMYTVFIETVPEGYQLIDGTNIDDLGQDRPGIQALQELEIITPFVEVSLTKKKIRSLSRMLGLSTWDLPSESCLATRIPTGNTINIDKLQRVALGERFLSDLGFQGCRVRFEEQGVVISVQEKDFALIVDKNLRERIISFFLNFSHSKVFLDFSARVG